MDETAMIRDLTRGNVARLLFGFSLPFVLANLLQTLYGMVDMIVVGQFVGSAGLSAVGIGSDLLSILTLLCTGFATAGQIMISQYVGKDDCDSISHTIGTMFTILLLAALGVTAVCCVLAAPLLRLVNTPDEAWEQAMAKAAMPEHNSDILAFQHWMRYDNDRKKKVR
ncbi:MAG: oligosaccharide flippase family protein [Clostridiales bacterium]|nr:oligosaccharide flippase family protein [Clostridiales bacterium]